MTYSGNFPKKINRPNVVQLSAGPLKPRGLIGHGIVGLCVNAAWMQIQTAYHTHVRHHHQITFQSRVRQLTSDITGHLALPQVDGRSYNTITPASV